jgi:hypothetical protein
MDRLPSLDEINKLTNDYKLNQEKLNKSDCEYMMNLIVETFDKAKKLKSDEIVSTNINEKKLYNISNTRMKNCKFGPNNESIDAILKSKGVDLLYTKYYYNIPGITYNKLTKVVVIVSLI